MAVFNKTVNPISIRLPGHLKEALNAIAETQERTLSQQVVFFLRSSVFQFMTDHPAFLEIHPELEECFKCLQTHTIACIDNSNQD